ncbi:MAG: hypothetical protein ABR540_11120 [Acidimicrobiales bacterium]
MAEESPTLGGATQDELRALHERSRRDGPRVSHATQDALTPPRRRGRRVAPVVLTAVLAMLVAVFAAATPPAAGAWAVLAGSATAAVVWGRSRGRESLHRLGRWGARVGTEVLANLPTPQRPR